MQIKQIHVDSAVEALLALGQATRLQVFRLLVQAGPRGRAAGEIAEALGVNASTLSRHLAQLERSGLVCSHREQRHIIYAIDWPGTHGLLNFLTEDCCKADPEIWGQSRPSTDCVECEEN